MSQQDPFDKLQYLFWTFAQHRIVTVAARTGLLDHLAENECTVSSAADALGLDQDACGKTIRGLVALGLAEASDRGFQLTKEVAPYFKQGIDNLSPFLEHSHQMYNGWGANLEEWLRTGHWPSTEWSEEKTKGFGAAMRAIGRHTARRVSPLLGLERNRRVLDVGGGLGHWAEVLCDQNPQLEVTVFDTPHTAKMAPQRFSGTALADRITFVGGDYLDDDFGSGYDMVLIANVLHQECADRAAGLVERSSAALDPGGRLCVVDFRIDPDRCGPLLGAMFAIHMRDFGNTWTQAEIHGWMKKAGLVDLKRQDVGELRWLISGRKGPVQSPRLEPEEP